MSDKSEGCGTDNSYNIKWRCGDRIYTARDIRNIGYSHGFDGVGFHSPSYWRITEREPRRDAPKWAEEIYAAGHRAGVSVRNETQAREGA